MAAESEGPTPRPWWQVTGIILLRVFIGIVIAVLLLFGLCMAMLS